MIGARTYLLAILVFAAVWAFTPAGYGNANAFPAGAVQLTASERDVTEYESYSSGMDTAPADVATNTDREQVHRMDRDSNGTTEYTYRHEQRRAVEQPEVTKRSEVDVYEHAEPPVVEEHIVETPPPPPRPMGLFQGLWRTFIWNG